MTLPIDEKKRRKVARHMTAIIETLAQGKESTEEQKRLDLKNTPERVAKMLVDELFSYPPAPKLHLTKMPRGSVDILAEGPIGFSSSCAHHLLPFTGHAWFAYLGDTKVIGLSKIARVVHYYSKRFQIQERLTNQCLKHLTHVLQPKAALMVMRAEHGCMTCRGVSQPDVRTVTSALYVQEGVGDSVRDELYRAIDRC